MNKQMKKVYVVEVDYCIDEEGHEILDIFDSVDKARKCMEQDIASSLAQDHPEHIEYNADKTHASYVDGKYNAFWNISEYKVK